MFAKDKITQSMIDAVNKVLGEKTEEVAQPKVEETAVQTLAEATSEKVPTPTGTKVFGHSYGNSKKARQDQTKSSVDTLKGPKDKEVKEELKGNQKKIDKNHNNKIDGQDFAILRGQKEEVELDEVVKGDDVVDKKSKMDALKTPAKPGPLHNVGKGIKAFLKGKPEPMESVEYEGEQLTEEQLDEMINEVLSKDATAGDYISDFVHSDNPKFAGKSKAERKKMALGAYYGKQNEESESECLTGKTYPAKLNAFKSFKVKLKGDIEDKVPEEEKPEETAARKSIVAKEEVEQIEERDEGKPGLMFKKIAAKASKEYGSKEAGNRVAGAIRKKVLSKEEVQSEATIAGTPGWKEMNKDVKDKSGATHTPMSRAKDLAKLAFKKVQNDLGKK